MGQGVPVGDVGRFCFTELGTKVEMKQRATSDMLVRALLDVLVEGRESKLGLDLPDLLAWLRTRIGTDKDIAARASMELARQRRRDIRARHIRRAHDLRAAGLTVAKIAKILAREDGLSNDQYSERTVYRWLREERHP